MSGKAGVVATVTGELVGATATATQSIDNVAALGVTEQLAAKTPPPQTNIRKLLMQGASNSETPGISRLQDPGLAAQLSPGNQTKAYFATQAAVKASPQNQQLPESPETYASSKPEKRTWYGWCCSVASSVGTVADTIGKAIIGAVKLGQATFEVGCSVVKAAVTDPVGTATAVWGAAKAVASFGYSAGSLLVNSTLALGSWCLNNPGKILPAIGSFLWSAGSVVCSLAASLFSSAYNGIKQVLSGEMSLGRALLNTFIFCCEMSGLADACRFVKHGTLALAAYATGDKQAMYSHLTQAAFAGAFVAVAFLTVGTGGIAAPVLVPLMAARALIGVALKQGVKQGLKACAREFLECGAKKTSEAVIQRLGEPAAKKLAAEAPQEMAKITAMAEKAVGTGASPQHLAAKVHELALERVIQREGTSIATTMGKSMGDEVSTRAAEVLTRQHVRQLGEEVGYSQTKALLKDLGLTEHVDDLTHDMIASFRDMSPKQARSHLMDTMGITRKEADQMTREVQRLIKSGKSDDAIKEVLEKQITADVSKFVSEKMEASFKETFRKGLRGELTDPDNIEWSTKLRQEILKRADELAKDPKTNPHGKSARQLADDLTDDLVEGAWEGVEAGIKRATRELVREGIDRAFKRLRGGSRTPRVGMDLDDEISESTQHLELGEESQSVDGRLGLTIAAKGEPTASSAGLLDQDVLYREVQLANGQVLRIKSTYKGEQLVAQEQDVISERNQEKPLSKIASERTVEPVKPNTTEGPRNRNLAA